VAVQQLKTKELAVQNAKNRWDLAK
jgi:hypothetical protein